MRSLKHPYLLILTLIVAYGTYFILDTFNQTHYSKKSEQDCYISQDHTSSASLVDYNSRILTRKNASRIIQAKFSSINSEFESVLSHTSKKSWITMRSAPNITIQRYATPKLSSSAAHYIKTIARINTAPDELQRIFQWDQFDKTQKKIDPFYERSKLLNRINSDTLIIAKTTKSPLFFPKRIFTLAMLDRNSMKDFTYADDTFGKIVIRKNTKMSSLVSVKFKDKIQEINTEHYVWSYQDFIAWFVDDGNGGTILTIVMMVNLGEDIPTWAFLTTVAVTGISSMSSLQNLLLSDSI